jgi:hypothetical protein
MVTLDAGRDSDHFRSSALLGTDSMTKKTGSDSKPDLRLVGAEAAVYDLMRAPETTAERVKRLQLEAHALALEEVEQFEKLLTQAADKAKDIASGGDAYPVGVREIAARLAADLPTRAETIRTIVGRVG